MRTYSEKQQCGDPLNWGWWWKTRCLALFLPIFFWGKWRLKENAYHAYMAQETVSNCGCCTPPTACLHLGKPYLMVLTGNCMKDPEFNPWRKWSSTQFKQGWKCLNKHPRKFNGDVCQQQSLVHQRWEIQWIKWNIQSFKVAISFNCPQKSMVAVPDQADVKSFSWNRMAWDLVQSLHYIVSPHWFWLYIHHCWWYTNVFWLQSGPVLHLSLKFHPQSLGGIFYIMLRSVAENLHLLTLFHSP